MELQQINDLSNDLLVCRLEGEELQKQLEELLQDRRIQELQDKIIETETRKKAIQAEMLEVMKLNELKSWKTEQATISRAKRYSAGVSDAYKKEVENKLKKGEEVFGWELREAEYISIRINK